MVKIYIKMGSKIPLEFISTLLDCKWQKKKKKYF